MAQAAAVVAVTVVAEVIEDKNPHARGDLISITNGFRDKFGTTGHVIRSGVTFLTIRNTITRKIYTRAWWNLTPVVAAAPSTQRR